MRKPRLVYLLALAFAISLSSCGGGSGSSGAAAPLTLNLDFTRNTAPADGSFKAIVWLSNPGGGVVSFSSAPSVVSTRGSVSALVARGDGKQEVTITPDAQKTGEYMVTAAAAVSGSAASVSHTAIVMEQVAGGWGQPFSIDGLVNTNATQDSLAVSPDGQYLFLQYYPVTLSCILSGDPNSAFCQTPLGPVTAPQRPNMPGASRVGLNSIHQGCPSIGFDPSPVPVPPIAMYGFHRQADGSYAEPFVFTFTGNDGCFAPWGPSLHANGDGSYRMFTAFNDPRNAGGASDFAHVYDFNFSPGTTQVLGNVSYSGAIQISNFILNQATIAGADTHRGNPHVYYNGNTPSLLFYDDETQPAAAQYIHVSQWNGSSWDASIALNFAPFNTTGFGDTQPYFDGSQLILRNGSQLLAYAYNGGALANASSWGSPTVLLAPQAAGVQAGSVIVIGEPTMATINGQQMLYFIYGLYRADGSVNLRAGYVRMGP
ncbi:MAG TPA: hypothetical protein VIF82_02075 [Burkholderiaceae bacterium]|jgi:hypothetical protein